MELPRSRAYGQLLGQRHRGWRPVGERASTPGLSLSQRATGLAALLLLLLLSASLALSVTLHVFGRAHPLQATRAWLALLLVLTLVLAWRQLSSILRLFRLPTHRREPALHRVLMLASASLAATLLVNSGFYLSGDVNYTYMHLWWFRTPLALLTVALLYVALEVQVALATRTRDGGSLLGTLRAQTRSRARLVGLLSLGGIGVLLGTSYVTVIGDDYARYWTIADALTGGWGYPASEVAREYQSGGMSRHLVDLPALPLAMIASFVLMGHNALAAMMPTLIAASLFPLAAYLALRELTRHHVLSYVVAVGLGAFPLLTFYVLRAAGPDGMFLTLLMVLAYLAIRVDRYRTDHRLWGALGVVAAAVALTRPEGLMYTGLVFLTLSFSHRSSWGFWLAAIICGGTLGAFSATMLATFGVPWPTSFVGTVRWEHAAGNLAGFRAHALPGYVEALGVPESLLMSAGFAVVALYLAGTWQLARRRPQLLFLALLPTVSLAMFLLVSPALTRPQLPYDFFRRASYGIPFLMLVAAYPIATTLRQPLRIGTRRVACSLLLALSVLVVSYEAKLLATPETVYAGGTQILTSGSYLLGTDLAAHPYQLPSLPFQRNSQGVLLVADSFDYMAFRADLNSHFAPMALHGNTRAVGHVRASLLLFLLGLCYVVALDDRKRSGVVSLHQDVQRTGGREAANALGDGGGRLRREFPG